VTLLILIYYHILVVKTKLWINIYSGKYLVTAIRHNFTGDGVYQSIIRDIKRKSTGFNCNLVIEYYVIGTKMENFLGKDNFIWWVGVVENQVDHFGLWSFQVRIFGWHDDGLADDSVMKD
jgi:hypothetical protein